MFEEALLEVINDVCLEYANTFTIGKLLNIAIDGHIEGKNARKTARCDL